MAQVKDNIVDLERVVDKLNKTLDENIRRLNSGATAVANYTSSFSNIPSQYLRLLSELSDRNRALQETQARLLQVETQLASLRQRQTGASRERAQRTSEEIVNQRELAQNADRQTRATSALVGAYNNLNAQHQIASRRLQDLIARGRTANQTQSQYNREIREAQRDFQGLDRRIQSADRAVGRFNRNVGNYRQAFSGLRDLIGAFGIAGGVTLFAGIATSIFQTTKELQTLDNALRQVTGTQEQMARSQEFLREVSEAYGLDINGLTKQFTQFYVSAKDKISGKEIEDIFRSVSKAGATMGLSVENQERAFLALNQMMSKGVVSAEELRGQLGEALPGAFGIMAKAVGVTEQELGKLMKDGKLLADEVLPKFARELEKVYGIETIERVETLTASQNRLKNSWTEFVRSLNESETGGISQFFKFIIDGLNDIANLLIRVNTSWDELNKQAGKKGANAGKKFFEENIKLNSSDIELTAKEKDAIKKRISDIKDLMIAGYNDPKLQKELTELYRKLNPSSSQAESLGNLADTKINQYTNKVEELNKKLAEIEAKRTTNLIKGAFGIGTGERTLKKKIEEYNYEIGFWKEVSQSADNYGKVVETVDKKTKNYNATKANTVKIQKEEEKLVFGTEAWLRKQISLLEETRSKTAKTNEEYKEIGGGIAFYTKWLETLTGAQKKSNEETEKTLKYGTIEYYESLQAELKALQQTQVENNEEFEKYQRQIDFYQVLIDSIRGVKDETKEAEKANTDYFDSFIDSFSSESGFSKLLDIFRGNIKDFGKDAKTTALAISEAFQEAFNTISNASQANFDAEYTRLEMQKENSLRFAGDSATAREEIERQAEEKRKAIARREAEAQKRLAIFNTIIDTSQAVVAALPNIPLSVAIGVIGAAQIALIASQQIPQFWMGGEHDGGLMMVNDGKGANYRETIVTPDGKIEKPTGRNVIMNRPKGTQIFTHDQWNEVINKQLSSAGIQPMRSTIETISQQNSLTTEDFNAGISKLAKSMQSNKGGNTQVYLNNKPINTDYFKGKNV
jgi:tape measure domain-containing protein